MTSEEAWEDVIQFHWMDPKEPSVTHFVAQCSAADLRRLNVDMWGWAEQHAQRALRPFGWWPLLINQLDERFMWAAPERKCPEHGSIP